MVMSYTTTTVAIKQTTEPNAKRMWSKFISLWTLYSFLCGYEKNLRRTPPPRYKSILRRINFLYNDNLRYKTTPQPNTKMGSKLISFLKNFAVVLKEPAV